MPMQLVTGSKNLSSWTMRVWLLMRHFGIGFQEVKVALNQPDTAERIAGYSPSGRIPCLILDRQVVWDSMAICEYLAEHFPGLALWPRDAAQRAHARSICNEMHSGFARMRHELPLDICARDGAAGERALRIEEVRRDVQRIEQIWQACLSRYGGPFLFGAFSIADAYFAPVVLRFRTYGIAVSSPLAAGYAQRIESLGPVQEWVAEAAQERSAKPAG
jgi:glutathione S-transferase